MGDESEPRTVYTTRHEAIEREIIGAFAYEPTEEYDIDGIADELLEWVTGYAEDGREYALSDAGHTGYRVREVSDAEFWEIAARHKRDPKGDHHGDPDYDKL